MEPALASLQAGWDQAAREDAMYNILTDPARQGGGWNPEEFFANGQLEIDVAVDRLDDLGVKRGMGRALDFGCGVGRLTQALARHYRRVDGVDVSNEMIRLAGQHNTNRRVHYHHNPQPELRLFKAGTFALVYSMIVLQHMPQALQEGYVSEFFRVLKPGGVAMFEIPDGPDIGHAGWWLSMYGVPRDTVERWIANAGGTLVDTECLGQDAHWQNYRYTACA